LKKLCRTLGGLVSWPSCSPEHWVYVMDRLHISRYHTTSALWTNFLWQSLAK